MPPPRWNLDICEGIKLVERGHVQPVCVGRSLRNRSRPLQSILWIVPESGANIKHGIVHRTHPQYLAKVLGIPLGHRRKRAPAKSVARELKVLSNMNLLMGKVCSVHLAVAHEA